MNTQVQRKINKRFQQLRRKVSAGQMSAFEAKARLNARVSIEVGNAIEADEKLISWLAQDEFKKEMKDWEKMWYGGEEVKA